MIIYSTIISIYLAIEGSSSIVNNGGILPKTSSVDLVKTSIGQYGLSEDFRSTPLVSSQRKKKALPKDTAKEIASANQDRLYQRIISKEVHRPDLALAPVNVTVRIMLIKILDLIEKNECVETIIRIQVGWRDRRLGWNKADFGDISEILLPSTAVWLPDLTIINSITDVYSVVRDTRFEVKLLDNGQIWWHPTGVLRTFCKLHLSYFPFDRQKCSIIVESPTLNRNFLNLQLRYERPPVDLKMYVKSETWHLVKTFGTAQYARAGKNTYFARLEFWVILERARLYHSINFILPCFILSVIQTVFFFLPVTHPQRVGSTTVTMLSVMVFQSMVVAQLPKTSESVPLLSIYIDLVILISATSVCASVFTAMCHFNNGHDIPTPKWLQVCCKCHGRKKRTPGRYATRRSRSQSHQFISPRRASQRQTEQVDAPAEETDNQRHELIKMKSIDEESQASIVQQNSPRILPADSTAELQMKQSLASLANTTQTRTCDLCKTDIGNKASANFLVKKLSIFGRRKTRSHNCSRSSSIWEEMNEFSGMPHKDYLSAVHNDSSSVSWLDVLTCIDRVLNLMCALAVSLGPAIIFGIIPNVVEHQDYPEPIGDNFTLLLGSRQ